jgi:phenylacetate-CoA ligase
VLFAFEHIVILPIEMVLLYCTVMRIHGGLIYGGWWKTGSFWPDRSALDRYQELRLRELIKHAGQLVPYYRNLLRQAGVDPAGFLGRCDLEKIPISRKSDFQNGSAERFLAAGFAVDRLIPHETGGSTGSPLTVCRTWGEERWLGWLRWKALKSVGWSPRQRQVIVAYQPPPGSQIRNRLHEWCMAAGFFRQKKVSFFLPFRKMLEEIAAFQPDVLHGYPTTLSRMVMSEPERCRRILRPRFITTGGETLTMPIRQILEEHFHVPVMNLYGSCECNLMAWECPQSGHLHVCEEGVILEVLDRNHKPVAPGETGEVVCTALHSFAMPIIRYSLADLATRGPRTCPCGNQLALLKAVQGRLLDYLQLPNGNWMHPYELIEMLFGPHLAWIAQYQLIQETTGALRLLIRPRHLPPSGSREQLQGLLSIRAGAHIEIALVEDIPLGHNGKFRVSHSKLTRPLIEFNSPNVDLSWAWQR